MTVDLARSVVRPILDSGGVQSSAFGWAPAAEHVLLPDEPTSAAESVLGTDRPTDEST
ncbi:hypothetical protein NVV95_15915 [Herbiconiux sp. CPCC 205716]|uniref:Uncharacterized protein n=1 Tax=Herbiconiux gentiana TaxID=2970912 RepID=A0ABT2GIT9_9MICO|nr:hypothetical protein [Herbiconiux gentiana]MCS5716031.1 hypothetical protein [Herbiconiux gentiana]